MDLSERIIKLEYNEELYFSESTKLIFGKGMIASLQMKFLLINE